MESVDPMREPATVMLALTKYFLRTGLLLVVGGSAVGWWGGMRLHRLLTASPIVGVPTTWQFAKWVVMPPVFLTLGLGFCVFGLILIGKGFHFHIKRSRESAIS
jgi:hypothetical protein